MNWIFNVHLFVEWHGNRCQRNTKHACSLSFLQHVIFVVNFVALFGDVILHELISVSEKRSYFSVKSSQMFKAFYDTDASRKSMAFLTE